MAAARHFRTILQQNCVGLSRTSIGKPCHAKRCFSVRHEMCVQSPPFGILFDIDGVIVRGKKVLHEAIDAFQKMSDGNGQLRVPAVFVTNAGNKLRQSKAKQLTEWLGIEIQPEQVVMSHSPLKMFPQFHDKHIMVSGQGPVKEIASGLGFTHVTTVDEVRDRFPNLDMVDHNRRVPPHNHEYAHALPKIDAIVLFGEPVRWETSLQLILDVLIADGQLNDSPDHITYPNMPVLGCNVDLMWMAEAPLPRLGHGSFMVCLEALYKKITGHDLLYAVLTGKPSQITYHCAESVLSQQARAMGLEGPLRTLYAIGDNPMTDIYGANLYNQYLIAKAASRQNHQPSEHQSKIRQGVVMSNPAGEDQGRVVIEEAAPTLGSNHSVGEMDHHVCESEAVITEPIEYGYSGSMESVLVYTGLHSKPNEAGFLDESHLELDHGHRDFAYNKELIKPTITAQNVLDAVNIIFEREGFE